VAFFLLNGVKHQRGGALNHAVDRSLSIFFAASGLYQRGIKMLLVMFANPVFIRLDVQTTTIEKTAPGLSNKQKILAKTHKKFLLRKRKESERKLRHM
jgi:hypothetical protein